MVFIIKFVSEEVDGFVREIAIDSEATFYDLHKMILASCNYSEGQMTSFHICDTDWERQQEITLEDMGFGAVDEDSFVMSDTRLSEFIEDKGQKLEYVFDTFANRSFYLKVKEVHLSDNLAVPQVVRSQGDAPEEIRIEVEEPTKAPSKKAVTTEEYDDCYSLQDFDEEDIDLEGFEISEELY